MKRTAAWGLSALMACTGPLVATPASSTDSASRMADGRPNLSGTYDTATLTPLQRPRAFGDNLFLTEEEAGRLAAEEQAYLAARNADTDPDREAPPEGGDGSVGASGNVGGYNAFWIDRGSSAIQVDGRFRTSLIVDPANGRYPPMTPQARERMAERRRFWRQNEGAAWWIDLPEPWPYDDPELRPLAERCLLGFSSTAGPPSLPALYNNYKRIVQTADQVMILVEMNHDARVVRLDSAHEPATVRSWLGDSIGWWEGDTLVVETTNFNDSPALRGATRDLKVTERFQRSADGNLLYRFTVEDPNVWESPWTGEYPWVSKNDGKLFEYACHEGNYALGNILRGARILEREALEAQEPKNP